MPKKYLLPLLVILTASSVFFGYWLGRSNFSIFKNKEIIPQAAKQKLLPLEKYTIENLAKRETKPSKITLVEELPAKTTSVPKPNFKSYLVSFTSESKRVTGQLNVPYTPKSPKTPNSYPAILMLRGYVDQKVYKTGDGTRNAAAVFAQNGYITFAPDFLGYGGSDPINPDVLEARFQTYTTALDALSALESGNFTSNLPKFENLLSERAQLQIENSLIWSHSNGGHIATTLLTITQKNIPTVLWAPVTQYFPYSVLYYTDETADRGKYLRQVLAEFERDYDTDLYSADRYLDRIQAPIELHQGTLDDAVPEKWSANFVKTLKEKDKDIKYYIYPGANHDLRPAWNTAVTRSLAFFNKNQ